MIEKRRFEDVELLTAATAPELGAMVRARVLEGWDIFGGLHFDGGIWAQYVVRFVVKSKEKEGLGLSAGPASL